MEPIYEVVSPSSSMGVSSKPAAKRLADLEGRRVAFLWDHVFRGDELFPVLATELTNRFPTIEIVGYDEFGNTHGGDEVEMIAGLPTALTTRHIDAVVSAVGC